MAAGSSELVDTMESLFANTEARIITAYKVYCTLALASKRLRSPSSWNYKHGDDYDGAQVIKCTPSTTSAWTKKKQPKVCNLAHLGIAVYRTFHQLIYVSFALVQPTGKERVICLTAERRHKRRGFKGSVHTCKPTGQGSYQVSILGVMPMAYWK